MIVIYGGSFNPVSIAHIEIMEAINNLDNVERIIIMPVGDQYPKKELISAKHRIAMLNEVIKNIDKAEISLIEVESSDRLYTYETLNKFNGDICLVVGIDNLYDLPNWKMAEQILEKYKIIVINRYGKNIENVINTLPELRKYINNFIELNISGIELISSTTIRNKIKNRESIDNLTEKSVVKYIKDNKLYI